MSETFVTADWHLGETRFDIMGRPFTTTEEHDETIIANHNAHVKPDDYVIVVGDVCYQKSPESLPLVAQLNGIKILIRGNHDRIFTDAQLKPYFAEIVPEGVGVQKQFWGIDFYITHYPTQGVSPFFNLVGHIHGAWKFQLNMMNIGVDVCHFYPVNTKKLPFFVNAVQKFYDSDVWVAYNSINKDYVGKRGAPTSYFTFNKK